MATSYNALRNIINRSGGIFNLDQKRVYRNLFRALGNSIDIALGGVGLKGQYNQLISGTVTWITGLTFEVSDCFYVIDGEYYNAKGVQVTLGTADGSNDRIDVFYADSDGNIGVSAGTPAATPVKPELDPSSQVELSFALIAAAATTPSSVVNSSVYLEDTEWTTAVSGTTVAKAATTDPYAGTKHIAFTDAIKNDYITLTNSAVVQVADYDKVSFYLKPISMGNTKGKRTPMWVQLFDGTTALGNAVAVQDGSFGFDVTSPAYQLVSIPISNFGASGAFDKIRFMAGGTLTAYVDNIVLQGGIPATDAADFARLGVSNSFTAAQGSSIQTLTDAATISWDCGKANVASVTLDGNRTMAAPTNVVPGFTYILKVKQDATTGSRTITWNAVFKWAGGTAPTLSTGTSAVDIISFWADEDGNLHGTLGIADSQ